MQNVALLINLGLAGTSLIVSVVYVHTSNLGGYSRAPDHCWLCHSAPAVNTAVLAFNITYTTDELHERETHAESKKTGRAGDEKSMQNFSRNTEAKRSLGKQTHRSKNVIKMNIEKVGMWIGFIWLSIGRSAGPCEHGSEPLASVECLIEDREFLPQLSDCQSSKKDFLQVCNYEILLLLLNNLNMVLALTSCCSRTLCCSLCITGR